MTDHERETLLAIRTKCLAAARSNDPMAAYEAAVEIEMLLADEQYRVEQCELAFAGRAGR